MTRRNPLILLELVAAAAAALSILAGVAFFLLTMGPIRLDFLTPYIENALSPPGGPITVKIDVTKLTWDGWQRPVDVRAEGVRILNPTGAELATLDQVSIGLSIPGLMRGLVAPTSLDIHRPTVRLTRARDGHFEFGLGDSGTGREQPALQRLVEGLLAPLDPKAASGYLERVSISDAVLTLDDQKLEMSWKALNANVEMLRGEGGFAADFQVPFLVDGKPAALRGKAIYMLAQETIEVGVEFADIVPARFAAGSPALERLAALNMPIGGSAEARFRWSTGEFERITFDLNGRKGRLMLPEFGPQGLEIAAAKVEGSAEQNFSFFVFNNVYFDLGGPNVSAAAVVSSISDRPEAKINAIVRRLDFADLDHLWPANVRPDLRQWVGAHVKSGRADETTIEVTGRMEPNGGFDPDLQNLTMRSRFSGVSGAVSNTMQLEHASGTARFGQEQVELNLTGAEVHWAKGTLPPLTDIKAKAALVPGRRADVTISDAKFGGLNLSETKIRVTGLDQASPEVDGEAQVRGSVGRLLAMMQKAELGGIGETGIDPATVKGEAAARTRFRFELGPKFHPDRIQRSAAAKIVDLAVPNGPMGLSISDGEMNLVYDARDIKLDGTLKLNGAPVSVGLMRTLAGTGRDQTHVHLLGSLNDDQRKAMGLGTEKILNGLLDFEVNLTRTAAGVTTADARLKLDRAKVELAQIYWEKPQGVPGTLVMTLKMQKGKPVEVSEFAVSSAGLMAEGRALMKLGSSDVDRIEFDTLSIQPKTTAGRTDVQAEISRRPGGGWDVALLGDQFDLQPYIDDPEILLDFPMTVTANLKRLRLGERKHLEEVGLTAAFDGQYWDSIDMSSLLPNKSKLRVRYTPMGERRELRIYSSDAAAFLRLATDASFARDIHGGELAIKAIREPMLPTTPIEGMVQLNGFNLRDTPIGDRILSSASGFGPFEVLSGEDLNFDRLEATFKKTGDIIVINDMLAMSRGLGMNGLGVFDMAAGTMDVSGFVSPFRGIGRLLDDNPWIGAFLVDVDRQGLIAVPFAGKGSFTDPDFTVGKKPQPLPPGEVRALARFIAGKDRDGKDRDLSAANRMQPAGMSR